MIKNLLLHVAIIGLIFFLATNEVVAVDTGACCLPGNSCIDNVTASECRSQDGIYQGDGSNCATVTCEAPTGACCLPNFTCMDNVTSAYCESQGGIYQGDGSNCAMVTCTTPTGACCLPGDACIDEVTASWCQSQGGVYQSDGTNCASITCGVCDCTPGNSNGDGAINVGDAVYMINYVFKSGPAPIPYDICSGDANWDCTCNVGDAVFIINYVFKGGPPPCDCPSWLSSCGPPLRK
ncbi:MAG: hypothetical protein GY841_06415 [FCB group bacterium]|nr:hypothetical protein [FCB group bacterium]